jgi:hypothetical protein
MFGVSVEVTTALSPDERVSGVFASNIEGRVAALQTRQYLEAAEDVSARADVVKLADCDKTGLRDEACARSFLEKRGRLAYRRPLEGAEIERYLTAYRALRDAADDHATALRVLVQALLQSGHFLYHLELEDPASPRAVGSVARLPAFALASRLSFLMWGSGPDDALLDRAASGALDDDAGIDDEAARLFDDPRARDAIGEFHSDWLGLPRLDSASRDPSLFPEFDAELVQAMRDDTAAFADHVIRGEELGLKELLATPVSFAKGSAAALLGAEGTPEGDHLALDPSRRVGILTSPAFLAAHSHSNQTSPILRGRAVRERFFCQPLGDPPPEVVAVPPPLDPALTTRERFAEHRTTGSACAHCHSKIDDLGFALEHFDALGRYRATENGKAIDSTGELLDTDVDGKMTGVVDLAERMGRSKVVSDCYASQWFRYALGRMEQHMDACSIERAKAVLADGGTVRELLMSIARSDSFVNKTVEASK